MYSADERMRYHVTPSIISQADTQNAPAPMSMVTAHLPGRHAKGLHQITWETLTSLFSGPVWHAMHTEWLMPIECQGCHVTLDIPGSSIDFHGWVGGFRKYPV